MPEIPEIGIGTVDVPVIPAWQAMPPQSIPKAPPVTLQLGFPAADMPGCVETRNTQPGNASAYDTDPRGNLVVCDGTMPSYRPLDLTPGIATKESAKPPAIDPEPKKSAGVSSQPKNTRLSSMPSSPLDIKSVATELPCPPPDAIPIGAKNKSQTAVVVGYELVDGKCETRYESLDVPTIVSNYLPGAPVVMNTAAVAAVATTSAILAKPLGDVLLKAIKPIVKKAIKKIKAKFNKSSPVESVLQRRMSQRASRK
jgi:hypothetical protein